ncbi:MAG: transcription termination factor NusA, partial [Microbacteriaceae bacterium]
MHIDIKNLRDIEGEKEIPFDELVDIVQDAVERAYVKHITPAPAELGDRPAPVKMEDEHGNKRARAVLDRKTGDIEIFAPTYNDDDELTGEEVVEDTDFGYIAASEAKRVLIQRIRAIDDEKILGEFSHKKGDLISGVVQQSSSAKMIHILIGKNLEAVMPSAEQVATEVYEHGKRIRVVITDVKKGLKGPSITVSRHHPDLVRRLFELEVPEIGQGLVKIAAISRHQGHRTKIAVFSTEAGFNAKGAFIGELGSRVRNVSKELGDEKIDIVDYSPNVAEFVAHALSPAKVTKAVLVDEATNAVRAFVPEYQLSLAIGKDGQNAR